ncbi:3'-5' exonuclease [Phenylobacterium sp. 58.2.17]|uniref:3'-5' exonuclease n=1 Tax=Phenylobacterium sp. 58.2.17 TaxID=2969306 RepID=UPI002265155F|nr:3'-5' exonuclease [Phenylobacterium sp. 58.2.17]MCX7584894.1 3'-5' exonuclease [Phenylobacterium sp. 58.2.17]
MDAILIKTEAAADLTAMAARLEASGDYRVLRRLAPRRQIEPHDGSPTRLGIFLDVETTGLDPLHDEIIELAMAPFTYGLDGKIFDVGEPFSRLREPSKPIPPQITKLTGIDDAMVAGHAIDPAEVSRFVAPAALVVAHNASFDRRFLERFCETFSTKPWACSMSQVDWVAEGHEGVKLAYLAMSSGFFYERHRALNDCFAAIELLANVQPASGERAFAQLLERARQATWRIWAENSPFDLKDILKARGYRWNGEASGGPRAWYVDVEDGEKEAELAFLKAEIYQRDIELLVRRIDAYDRFSDRC